MHVPVGDAAVARWDWQVVDGGVRGSIHVNQLQETFSFTTRFYMHRNFNNFIEPESVFIDIGNDSMVTAIRESNNALVIVALNPNPLG